MVKKNIDKSGLDQSSQNKITTSDKQSSSHAMGIAGDPIIEPVPKYIKAKNEVVLEGQNNTWVVFGRDRPKSRLSGYGGLGDTQCGAIDIVVGRLADKPRSDVFVDPNFIVDAARIHISQKTDVDKNFNLASGKVGNAKAKSAIGIKADGVRIVAREGIKLVTGTDGSNSQGGTVDTTLGVDLIAGNKDEDLQSMVKGDNLATALDRALFHMENLSGIISTFLQSQMKFNAAAGTHFHISPFYGVPTTPSTELSSMAVETQMNQMQDCIVGLQKFKTNLASYKNTYLRKSGEKYINSRYHSLN